MLDQQTTLARKGVSLHPDDLSDGPLTCVLAKLIFADSRSSIFLLLLAVISWLSKRQMWYNYTIHMCGMGIFHIIRALKSWISLRIHSVLLPLVAGKM